MKNKIIIFCTSVITLLVFSASAVCATTTDLKIDSQSVVSGVKSSIPVSVTGASKLGAMDIQLQYDPSVLTYDSIALGELSQNGLVEAKADESGVLMISFVDTKGISGEGETLVLAFTVNGKAGSISKLNMEARAYGIDLKDIPLSISAGDIKVEAGNPISSNKLLLFGAIALGVIILVIVVLIVIKKKK